MKDVGVSGSAFRQTICVLVFVCPFYLLTSGWKQKNVPKPLNMNSNESILEYHKPTVPLGHKDYALQELMRALLFLDQGDYLDSDIRLANACQVMDQITDDKKREKTAVVWAESSKTYKGEPYERATAYFYRGLCRYKLGDYSGALAAFRHSLACDAETRTKEQKYLEDFTISHFMAALCYNQLGELDNAKTAIRIAQSHDPNNQYLTPEVLNKNFILIITVGDGPYITPSKIDVSIKRIGCPKCKENEVEIYVDDKQIGSAAETVDLCTQAKSQSTGEMDKVRMTKSAGKHVLSFVPYASLATMAIREEVDFRCWRGLPRKYCIFATDIESGLHTVSLKFRSNKGEEMPQYGQVWFDIPVTNKPGEVYYFRSTRNSQNISSSSKKSSFEPKSAIRPEPVYCFDAVGHTPGTKPFILGGMCCCTPTKELMEQYHADGFLKDMELQDLIRLYEERGIKTALDHTACNNLCTCGPHVVKGGKCMVSPTPGTTNLEEVRFGIKYVPVDKKNNRKKQMNLDISKKKKKS